MEPYQRFAIEMTLARNELMMLFDGFIGGLPKRRQEDARRAFGQRLDTYTARLTAYVNALPKATENGG